jgi:hypothetical protein
MKKNVRINMLLASRERVLRATVEDLKASYVRGNKKLPPASSWAIYENAFALGWAAAVKEATEAGHLKGAR